MPSLLDLLKPRPTRPLPDFPRIDWRNVMPASALLFYGGGPAITQMAATRMYRHPYHPAAFHAALYLGNGDFLNVGKFKTVERLSQEFRSTRRIDVISYEMPGDVADAIARDGYRDADKPKVGMSLPTYGVTDFLRFGLKWWKPSTKDICSENVTEILRAHGVECAEPSEPFNVAPWHLLEWAEKNPSMCQIKTIHVGGDFRTA